MSEIGSNKEININKEVSPSPNTQNGFGEANIQNIKLNKVINLSFNEQNTKQIVNMELNKEIVIYTDNILFLYDKQGISGI